MINVLVDEISNFFSHPFVLLVTGAIITSILIPWLTNRWQDHKKKIEIKIDLVSRISETVTLGTANIASILLAENHISTLITPESTAWVLKGKVVGSNIRAYFSGSHISDEWDEFFHSLWDFWGIAINLSQDSVKTITVPEALKTHFSYAKDIRWENIENKKKFIDDLVKLDNLIMEESDNLIKKIIEEPMKSF